MGSKTSKRFSDLIVYVDQLIDIHGKLKKGKGRRHHQEALHRAGVVLTIAAWESYVEEVLREAYDVIMTNGLAVSGTTTATIPAWAQHLFKLRATDLGHHLKQFNTPNAQNVRRLMEEWLGLDPTASWQWNSKGPGENWNAETCRKQLDLWLRIRHGVAHGGGLPKDIPWLQGSKGPRLVLYHMKDCKHTLMHLVRLTDEAIENHLKTHFGIATPW
jgi:hypothetical protein